LLALFYFHLLLVLRCASALFYSEPLLSLLLALFYSR
jgi:hypothetical protein